MHVATASLGDLGFLTTCLPVSRVGRMSRKGQQDEAMPQFTAVQLQREGSQSAPLVDKLLKMLPLSFLEKTFCSSCR